MSIFLYVSFLYVSFLYVTFIPFELFLLSGCCPDFACCSMSSHPYLKPCWLGFFTALVATFRSSKASSAVQGIAVKTSNHLATTEHSLIRPSITIAKRSVAGSITTKPPGMHCFASVFA